jgi:hypothetical protein
LDSRLLCRFHGPYCDDIIATTLFIGGDGVDDLFLALAVLFSIGMMVLMIKYAKFIHNQPKMEEERRQDTNKENPPPGDNS